MTGVPLRIQTVPPPTEMEMTKTRRAAVSRSAAAIRNRAAGQRPPHLRAGGRFRTRPASPRSTRDNGKPRTRLATRGLGTENRTDPVLVGLQQNPSASTRRSISSAPTIIPATTAPAAAPHATSSMPTTVRRFTPGRTPSSAIAAWPVGESRPDAFRRTNRAIRSSTASHRRHPDQPVHRLPRPSRHQRHEQLPRLHVVGRGDRRRADVSARSRSIRRPRSCVQAADDQSRRDGRPRQLVESASSWRTLPTSIRRRKHTQFADFHGHGWVFRAVFKTGSQGQLARSRGHVVTDVTTAKLQAAVAAAGALPGIAQRRSRGVADTAVETGARPRRRARASAWTSTWKRACTASIAISSRTTTATPGCRWKCGRPSRSSASIATAPSTKRPTLAHHRPGAYTSVARTPHGPRPGRDLRTPFGKPRFERSGKKIYPELDGRDGPDAGKSCRRWTPSTRATRITTRSPRWPRPSTSTATKIGLGQRAPTQAGDEAACAHCNKNMSCIACHSSWNPSCFGCHLPQKANIKMPNLHNEGDVTRKLHRLQLPDLRDDVFMLARDGDVTGNRIGPARSSCAHPRRLVQQQPRIDLRPAADHLRPRASAASPSAPTCRTPLQRRNGRDRATAGRDQAAPIATLEEQRQQRHHGPAADAGHQLRELHRPILLGRAPASTASSAVRRHRARRAAGGHRQLRCTSWRSPTTSRKHVEQRPHAGARPRASRQGHQRQHAASVPQDRSPGGAARGEYLYAACGEGGVRVFDIAFIDDKGFSRADHHRPGVAVGQKFYVPTKYATAVAAPTHDRPRPDPQAHPREQGSRRSTPCTATSTSPTSTRA